MKALAFVLALLVSACATVPNPVTKDTLNTAESAAVVVFVGLNAYKQSCIRRVIPQTCQTVIRNIQTYTLQLPPVLDDLRKFVKENDQVNALIAYNAAITLIAHARVTASANNVPLGAN